MNIEQINDAIARARTVAEGHLERVPSGFGPRSAVTSEAFHGAAFDTDWVVTKAEMISEHFQLIDATVRQQKEHKRPFAVAILTSPTKRKAALAHPDEKYLRKFQELAWKAFGVVWVLGDGPHAWQFLGDAGGSFPAGDVNEIAARVKAALTGRIKSTDRSTDAERQIAPLLRTALGDTIKQQHEYRGLWREPEADFVWSREGDVFPKRVGIEIKVNEDPICPLCQPLELLAEVDAVVRIRVLTPGSESKERPWAHEAKKAFETAAPVRYIDILATE